MRRFALFVTGGAIWLLLMAVPVFADNGPHVMGQAAQAAIGSCSGCHRAHSGQAPMLIKEEMPNLCYTCHNGTGATTNVQGGEGYAANAGALRGGGFQFALIATGTLAANPSSMPSNGSTLGRMAVIPTDTAHGNTSAHSVDGSGVTQWGAGALNSGNNGTAVNLNCASCHNPHGNGQYRILNPAPDGAYTAGVAASVKINDATVKSYSTTNYGQVGQFAADNAESPLNADGSSLNYTIASKTFQGTYLEASSRWCAMCHTRYFAGSGSAGNQDWTIAGSGDPTFDFRHAQRNIVDPTNNGAPTTGIIGPLNASSTQIRANGSSDATYNYSNPRLGNYTSGTGATAMTYRGVAVITRTAIATGIATDTSAIASATAAGDWLSTGAPRCITCHVSHGTNAVAGAYTTNEDSLVTGSKLGSTLLRLNGRTVCQACHAK